MYSAIGANVKVSPPPMEGIVGGKWQLSATDVPGPQNTQQRKTRKGCKEPEEKCHVNLVANGNSQP